MMFQKFLIKIYLLLVFLLMGNIAHAQYFTVERVVDGDTIIVSNPDWGLIKVGLIGIEAPESKFNNKARKDSKALGQDLNDFVRMGVEAKEFVEGLIKKGQKVRVHIVVHIKDKYGRLLGYVYIVTPKGPRYKIPDYSTKYPYYLIDEEFSYTFFLNATMIKAGFATELSVQSNEKYEKLFNRLHEEAREDKRGLWKYISLKDGGANIIGVSRGRASSKEKLNWEWVSIGSLTNPSLPPYDSELQNQYINFIGYCQQKSIVCGVMGYKLYTINIRSDQFENVKRLFNDAITKNPNRWSKLNLNIEKRRRKGRNSF